MAVESGRLSHRPPLLTKVPDDWGSGNAKVFALRLWVGESSQSPAPGPRRWGLEELALPYQPTKSPQHSLVGAELTGLVGV